MWLLVALVTILVTIPIYCEDINYSDRKYINDNTEDLGAYNPMQDEPPTFIRQKLEEDVSKVSIRYLLTTCSSNFVILNFLFRTKMKRLTYCFLTITSTQKRLARIFGHLTFVMTWRNCVYIRRFTQSVRRLVRLVAMVQIWKFW